MRLIYRILGTWFLGAALILIIVDGTKSLASNSLIMTSLAGGWQIIHAQSLVNAALFLEEKGLSWVWDFVSTTLLSWPAWAVFGVPGLLFAFMGRSAPTQIHSYDHN